ncbi:MAG: hypothetical protein FJY29_10230 [Betaproteobacteria bacterium]|nr:hypothetical protein [Betaproteobacteria bacterium]
MSSTGLITTLVLFQAPVVGVNAARPAEREQIAAPVLLLPNVVRAFGARAVFDVKEFERIWTALFGESPNAPGCGQPKRLTGSDRALIDADAFLVAVRGFSPELCKPEAWHVAAMRLDSCRVRQAKENNTKQEIHRCAQDGKFSEIRFVLQPVLQHDRGNFFPDAALHVAYSFKDFTKAIALWRSWSDGATAVRWRNPQGFFDSVRKNGTPNDVSLFISGLGQERWTFARVVAGHENWIKDRLDRGVMHESLTDADPGAVGMRTPPTAGGKEFSADEFLDPIKVTPLQGSCVGCHLAPPGRAARMFRHFGWGLAGEAVISARVLREAEFSARELQILEKSSRRK